MTPTEKLIAAAETYGARNYHPLPVVLSRGEGARVWDVEGREYLDFLASYSALNFGHHHPRLVAVLKEQVEKLSVSSRAFHSEELCLFSEELAKFCGLDKMLPMNTGSEAVETALKLARKWGYKRRGVPDGKAKIIAFENNFHGRTVTIVSFSSENLYREGFGPFTPGFEVIPFGDISRLERAIDGNTVAAIMEPVQAEAGIIVPPAGYLGEVRELCTRKGILLLADEIQTGLGRTGRDFCLQHEQVVPDILILGKSLGGGLLPVSAVVGKKEVMEAVGPGEHGSTFGGNPLASAVGRASLRVLREEKLSEMAARLGEIMMTALRRERLPGVREIRGKGALIGIELEASTGGARKYCEKLATRGVLCKETHGLVIRIAPPLVISESDALEGIGRIVEVIRGFGS